MGFDRVEVYTCDRCGASERRGHMDGPPAGWFWARLSRSRLLLLFCPRHRVTDAK